MKVGHMNILLLSIILVVTLAVCVNGSVWNGYYCQALPVSCEAPEVILQSGTAGTSIIYTNNTSAKVSVEAPVWLSGWDRRVKITIDNNDVDSALSDFPVLVCVSNSSGRHNDDVTFVFDEVGSNSKKIAVTTSNGTTECYVEIEKWDAASGQAWLWVKVPSISNTTETDLYLYYDADHADNTGYVGEPDSIPAEAVWDSYFKTVLHLHETSGIHYDSTSNNNNGTPQGGVAQDYATGEIDGADDFNGADGYIDFSTSFTAGQSEVTLELWVYLDEWVAGNTIYDAYYSGIFWQFSLLEGTWYTRDTSTGSSGSRNNDLTWSKPGTAAWHHLALRYTVSDGVKAIYVDGSLEASTSTSIDALTTDRDDERLGYPCDGTYFDGKIDELRISTGIARSAAWIKASYESERDDLLNFGPEDYVDETCDLYPPSAKGTHDNFSAQQAGPDSVYDTLTEENTGKFVVSVEMVELDFSTTDTQVSVGLSKSQNISTCIPLVTQYIGDGANNYWDEIFTDVYFSGSNVYAQRRTSGHILALSIAIIEFDGSSVKVQSGAFMLDNNLGTTIDIIGVNTTRAFTVIHYNTTARQSEFGEILICASFVDSDTIKMERWNSIVYDDSDIEGHWYVVEAQNEEFLVQEEKWTHTTGGTSGTHTINEVQMNKTILIATYCQDQGSATYSDESSFRIDLQDSTTIRWRCGFDCDDVTFYVYVIEFQGNEYVQRGTIAMPSTSEVVTQDLSSAVNLTRTIVHGVTFHGQTETDSYGASECQSTMTRLKFVDNDTIQAYHNDFSAGDQGVAWEVIEFELGDGANYELDLEVQWRSVDYDETNEELCIKTGTFSGSEDIQVKVWNSAGSFWDWVMNLTASQWNNVSVTSYLTTSTFTVQFLGGTESSDVTPDSWNIDVTLLHVWTDQSTYDYVLKIVNQAAVAWKVNLTVYSNSGISRLSNATINLHDGTTSDQIIVSGGVITQSEGPVYDLLGSAIIYISISNLQATTADTSYLYVYLKILVPGTSTYNLFVITLEIT